MARFITRSPRYINNVYIYASPEAPVEIELPEGTREDAFLLSVDNPDALEPLKPHFNARTGNKGPQSSVEFHSKPAKPRKPAEPVRVELPPDPTQA